MGIRAVQLRGQVHGRSQPLRLRTRVPFDREGEGLHFPPLPEALNLVFSQLASDQADQNGDVLDPVPGMVRINRATSSGSSIWTKCRAPGIRNSSDSGRNSWNVRATP